MPRPAFPKNLRQFQSQFATEEACRAHLSACRWPDGFLCSRCRHQTARELTGLRRWQCARCRHQVSLTAGTVLHNTKLPLTVWFWTAYLMTTDKRGISALLLQCQLDLGCYETAWRMLHKFRRAMVNLEREPLWGEVEVDETWVGGTQAGLRGEPSTERPESGSRHCGRGEAGKSVRASAHGGHPRLQERHSECVCPAKCGSRSSHLHGRAEKLHRF